MNKLTEGHEALLIAWPTGRIWITRAFEAVVKRTTFNALKRKGYLNRVRPFEYRLNDKGRKAIR